MLVKRVVDSKSVVSKAMLVSIVESKSVVGKPIMSRPKEMSHLMDEGLRWHVVHMTSAEGL